MKENSFFIRLSKSIPAFILIVLVLVSSILVNQYVNNYMLSEFYPDFVLEAEELDYVPSKYVPFSALISFGIESVFSSSDEVLVSTNVFSKIGKITAEYGTHVVKYADNYYRLSFDIPDEVHPGIPLQYIILSYALSFISSIMILLIAVILLINILKILNRAFLFG